MRGLAAVLLLAACAAPVAPDYGASVTVSSRAGTTTVYVDDRVLDKRFDRDGGKQQTKRVIPGAYDRAVAVIAANGPAALATVQHGPEVCADYGTDLVRIEPATADFDMLITDCPDPAMTTLMAQVLAAMARP